MNNSFYSILDGLNEDELKDFGKEIANRREALGMKKRDHFSVGDDVYFKDRGYEFLATVEKINRKRMVVKVDGSMPRYGNQKFNVPFTMIYKKGN